jgi:hypothetical protein
MAASVFLPDFPTDIRDAAGPLYGRGLTERRLPFANPAGETMRTPILASLILLLAANSTTGQSPNRPAAPPGLANGVYSIIRRCSGEQATLQLGNHERAVVVASPCSPPEILVVADSPNVALDLAKEPVLGTRPDGVHVLSVELNQKQSAALLVATNKHLNERIAIIVDNVVAMSPTVRTSIQGGKFEITAERADVNRLKESLWPLVQN